ncbi:MAG: glycosyltransferase [Bacteroidia bacterium]|nr:glycosyltransferase [Bacteroidia bacterium]
MKVSLVTACYNSEKDLEQTLKSVADQTYNNIEHVLVDGGSTDSTLDIIKRFDHVTNWVSEPDKGIYDALNKGVQMATGDVIGFVHSDDYLLDNTIIASVVEQLTAKPQVSAIYGDIIFVNDEGKTIRYYSSKSWSFKKMAVGKMPAHPSFFARKEVYDRYLFNLNYKIAADFDHILRVSKDPEFSLEYIPLVTTAMRMGGASTDGIKSNIRINKEILAICKSNGVKSNYLKIYSKYPSRLLEFLKREK